MRIARSHVPTWLAPFACLLIGGALGEIAATRAADDSVDYLRHVKPLLMTKCAACHGAVRSEGGLRLDAASLIKKGGENGPVVVAGQATKSRLIERVSATGDERMPPAGEGEPLTVDQIRLLQAWIDQGTAAPDEPTPADPREHWAYRAPQRVLPSPQGSAQTSVAQSPSPPAASASATSPASLQTSSSEDSRFAPRHLIDLHLADRHRAAGLVPARETSRATLLRRAYLDLVGLPPDREQLREFLDDSSPDAYERVIDRLLASPRHGERWARHWMDVWRYSDWAGFGNEIRYSQRHVWRWRDWIVESLNRDKPYDRMVLEMLAADELSPGDDDALRATGFLARNWYKFDRNSWLDDTIEHTSLAFLGVTMKCARCHDHKYDPIEQTEYYRLRAVFEPYDVRIDAMPGELDLDKNGLARVYDARPDDKTFRFLRGDPKKPDKDHPLDPGVPAILGGDGFAVAPVSLPLLGYYPAARPFFGNDLIAQATAAVVAAEAELAKSREQPNGSAGVALAECKLATARARRAAVEARVEAERVARMAEEATPAVDNSAPSEVAPREARLQASRAERLAALADAEEKELVAQQALDKARETAKPDDEKAKMAIADAEKKLKAAQDAVEAARKKSAEESESFTALGTAFPKSSTGRRLALAKWIVDARNPLTARVGVNQLWLRHFGQPIVENVADFGLRSPDPPLRPILDALAVEWLERSWSMKEMHRVIVTSAAYRLSSRPSDAPATNVAHDPDNRWQWRAAAQRVEAETVRDSLLSLAGHLDLKLGGPDLDQQQGLVNPRRSVYFRHSREKLMEFLQIFDAANPEECYRRRDSIRPQQAFALVNSSLALAQSRRLAARLTNELTTTNGNTNAGTNGNAGAADSNVANSNVADDAFVVAAFETILCRPPSEQERSECLEFLAMQARQLSNAGQLKVLGVGADPLAPSSDPRQRARENLVLVLVNHNDFVTVR